MVSNILDPNEVGRGFEDTGVAIRDAMRGELAYLGDPTTELIEQLPDGTFVQDVAGFVDAVLVHGLRENPAGVRYAQWPADLDRRFRGIFKTPVRVTPGSHGHLVITRLAIEESAEWLHNVPTPQQFSIKLPSIDFLALRAQSPASWTLRVSPGLAIEAGVQYLVQTYQTAFDFETEAAGVTAGNALAVLVTVTPSTNTFGFNVGSEFVYDPVTQTPSHEAAFGDYPSTVTPPAIPIGYVRLYPTQTEITQDDIFPAQLGGSGGGIPFSLPVDDTTAIVNDPVDDTRLMRIDVGNVATATTRTLEMPDADVLLRKNNYAASVAPAVSDDNTQGYAVGSVWIDTTADLVYQCADASAGAAVWLLLSVEDSDSITFTPATVLGSTAASIDISSIPGGWYALQFIIEGRTDRATTNDGVSIRFNGDSGSNYSYHSITILGAPASMSAVEGFSQAQIIAQASMAGNTAAANYLGRLEIIVFGYTNTANQRIVRGHGGVAYANSANNVRETLTTGHWLNTADAINQITVLPQVGSNFSAGTRYTLRLFGRL